MGLSGAGGCEPTTRFAMRGARFSIPLIVGALLAGCSNGQGGIDHTDTGLVLGSVAGGVRRKSDRQRPAAMCLPRSAARSSAVSSAARSAQSLDERDRRLAQEAEYDALERGQSGVSRQWRDPDNGHYGEIVPSRPYKRGVADCRDYTHTVYIDGRPKQMRGTACRNPDGTWQNVG